MEPGSIVEALDEGKDIALGLGAGVVVAMMNELGLQGMEEALVCTENLIRVDDVVESLKLAE